MKAASVTSVVAVAAICFTSRDALDYSEAAESAIDAMNQFYYDEDQGRWSPDVAWWLSGFALQDILDFMHKTGSRKYLRQARHIIDLQKAVLPWWPQGEGNFRADSTDDMGWWALTLLGIHPPHVLQKRHIQPALHALHRLLANRIPDDKSYLSKALATWDWLHASGMLNPSHLFNDGLAKTNGGICYNNKLPTWTYNQGVILGALTELFQATKNHTYLTTATAIASAVLSSPSLSPSSILTEPCEWMDEGCNNDQEIFKGVFAKHLAALSAVLEGDPYREYLEGNAKSAMAKAKGEGGLFDLEWKGPFRNGSLWRQGSVVGLFVGLI
ncbi:glycosyl hydrolase family 76-domain-containing protein [Immersiella caudata]|uniref:Glycosyl hydrolase family 76-domain-containing protein n=1 Tax=Immersiella caudata TaxID=314043 RepID=A0AA39WXN0_9PEZI|nr:glycosyl hydrolase family 76-domain-containing protein [Immersiella caudata]